MNNQKPRKRLTLIAWVFFTLVIIIAGGYAFWHVVKILASSPAVDTFTDETKIAAKTNITVDTGAGQVKLSEWTCGDTVAYEGGHYDANGTTKVTGGYYRTVLIDTQCWLKDDLNVGTMIGSKLADNVTLQNQTNNSVIEKYCYTYVQQDNAGQIATGTTNCNEYGGFYQWPEAVQYSNGVTLTSGTSVALGNIQGICPTGWHIPSDTEYVALSTYLGGDSVSSGKMKEAGTTHWTTAHADNSSGFTGLGAGFRHFSTGAFSYLKDDAFYWFAKPNLSTNAYYYNLFYNDTVLYRVASDRAYGMSIRCLKD